MAKEEGKFMDFSLSVMTPLESQVAEAGTCPFCHKKSLVKKFDNETLTASQCSICGHVFVVEPTEARR